jgi:hypothetical protein
MKDLIKRIIKEETDLQTKLKDIITKFGINQAINAVGGFDKFFKIMEGTNYFTDKFKIEPTDIKYFLRGDYNYRSGRSFYTQIILDPWDLWDGWESYDKGLLIQYVNKENLDLIRQILSEENDEDLSDVSINEILDYDNFNNIGEELFRSANQVDSDAYGVYLQNTLSSALEEYGGKIISFDDTGIELTVDYTKQVKQLSDENREDYFEEYPNGDIFTALVDDYWINKPDPFFKDYWYNYNFDHVYFNEILFEGLNEYL